MDFTLHTYTQLLNSLLANAYTIYTFEQYLTQAHHAEKFVILRHDVDIKAQNALRTAQIEKDLGINASYYFRVVPQSNQPAIIRQIAQMGHEIGYHYEDLSLCKGDVKQAIQHFEKQLAYFRIFYPVKTICMHGSPTSRIDNRDIWKHINYKDYNLLGEPYFDIDFQEIFYLTDTGRRWDGFRVSVRDKIPQHQDRWISNSWVYRHTKDIIQSIENQQLSPRLMITTHPQRWTNNKLAWFKEYLLQNTKNKIKKHIIHRV